nr:beta-ketoacyl synthase N-terminal-like domain-containing protein [Bacillus paralicheniformis]
MNHQILHLYQQISEKKISHEAAIKQLKSLAAQREIGENLKNYEFRKKKGGPQDQEEANNVHERAVQYFKQILASVVKLPPSKIEDDIELERYGIDSVMILTLTERLETVFGPLSKTLFFEYPSVEEITAYFIKHHSDKLLKELEVDTKEKTSRTYNSNASFKQEEKKASPYRRRETKSQGVISPASVKEASSELDIAIIGLAGRYPFSANKDELWDNLKQAKNCVTEIPKERWDHSIYYDPDKEKTGKTNGKWGGFIEGIDQFDPLFFNISPREAELMDPQERLFLECVYETLEDAGYTSEALAQRQEGEKADKVGVYVGVMYDEYQLYGAQAQVLNQPLAIGGSSASIANRVSYYFDFHGPSVTVDTMCSSSLTAVHLACQSLVKNEANLAIAGGVNLILHPNKYLVLSQGKFLSSNGLCESFGKGGDGYVPGEGVGAVLLKPLSKAIEDKDHIYGVIKGSAINHGGRTNGYTVPNPKAQASVIHQALEDAGVHPREISYIEAHGTGTSLGDPIEIEGLTKVYKKYTGITQYCSIGSVKSNIGHCESAAGIAGLTKVLMQLKHQQLVPSIHSTTLNQNIDFSNSPFVVQQEVEEWKRPTVEIDGSMKEVSRIAGISSFGAGGANAHLIVEEYNPVRDSLNATPSDQAIIVLSAKNEVGLYAQVRQLLGAIKRQSYNDSDLMKIAYTLQVGREAMNERLGFVVSSIPELEQKLQNFLDDNEGTKSEGLYRGQVRRNKETLAIFMADDDLQNTISNWISRGKYAKLLDLWVKGLKFDWNRLYTDDKPGRISLPTYPFARERYWIPKLKPGFKATHSYGHIHPLLHRNTSNLSVQRYSTTFDGTEFFTYGNSRTSHKMITEMTCLEMVRAAIEDALEYTAHDPLLIRFEKIVWKNLMKLEVEPLQAHIELYPIEEGRIGYEIYCEDSSSHASVIISTGAAVLFQDMDEQLSLTDIPVMRNEDDEMKSLQKSECYELLREKGLDYEDSLKRIEFVKNCEDEAHVKLSQMSESDQTSAGYVLHPGLMESAVQASILLTMKNRKPNTVRTRELRPAGLDKFEFFGSCHQVLWLVVKQTHRDEQAEAATFDVTMYNEFGQLCIKIEGLVLEEITEYGDVAPTMTSSTSITDTEFEIEKVQKESIKKIEHEIINMVSRILKVKFADIDVELEWNEFGFDSVTITELTKDINDSFQIDVQPTIFFEHLTIRTISRHLNEKYQLMLSSEPAHSTEKKSKIKSEAQDSVKLKNPRFVQKQVSEQREIRSSTYEPIAIIGMSGKFPKADNVDELWKNLVEEKDCISEVPKDRWDWKAWYGDPLVDGNKTDIKWGDLWMVFQNSILRSLAYPLKRPS